MIHHHEHIEQAQEINKAFGGTVYGNIILALSGVFLAVISNVTVELKEASDMLEYIVNWAIKIGALTMTIYGVINARSIYKRNQDIKKNETDVQ
jgi:hypothetical protein